MERGDGDSSADCERLCRQDRECCAVSEGLRREQAARGRKCPGKTPLLLPARRPPARPSQTGSHLGPVRVPSGVSSFSLVRALPPTRSHHSTRSHLLGFHQNSAPAPAFPASMALTADLDRRGGRLQVRARGLPWWGAGGVHSTRPSCPLSEK